MMTQSNCNSLHENNHIITINCNLVTKHQYGNDDFILFDLTNGHVSNSVPKNINLKAPM